MNQSQEASEEPRTEGPELTDDPSVNQAISHLEKTVLDKLGPASDGAA
ncbi:hypothetical protein SEA_SATIS_100 [Streptomyces phage Satis]|nr:hypothetical protein SEA_SATIS_100 [Streptomyces phage Satis]QBZ71998.1 hypothetical protein SEA_KRADAL_100 [Streptomyces phage Kradal]